MTIDQAVAILEAERVLQRVGCDGPDANPGSAWHDYVQEAGRLLCDNRLLHELCDGLHLLEDDDD